MNAKLADLACREVVELVTDYLGHVLTPSDRQAFDAHLETCPPCTIYLEQMKTVVSTAGSLGKPTGSEEVEQELLALFQGWRAKTAL
jgi:anti-sigma factor RsiW